MIFAQRVNPSTATTENSSPIEFRTSTHNRIVANRRRCAVKKHRATRLHYDLRLDFGGILISFAILRGPSCRPGESRVAVRVDDHDREYITSERLIPPGEHGAGPVMLWDEGFWIPLPGYEDIPEALGKGCLRFTLECSRLKGNWMLRRRPGACRENRREIWELIKEEDQFARAEGDPDILVQFPDSISTGRSLDEIEQDENRSAPKGFPVDQLTLIFTFEP